MSLKTLQVFLSLFFYLSCYHQYYLSYYSLISQYQYDFLYCLGNKQLYFLKIEKNYQIKDYNYDAIETCATDGLCELACPVNINTGSYMKSLRQQDLSNIQKSISKWAANHFSFVQAFARTGLRLGKTVQSIFGKRIVVLLSKTLNLLFGTPIWNSIIPSVAPSISFSENNKVDKWVYFPSCVNRTISSDNEKSSLITILNEISSKKFFF